MDNDLLLSLAVASGLGLIIGLQRQWRESEVAGIRTFPLITLFGVFSSVLAENFGGWIIAGGMLAVAAMLVISNLAKLRGGDADPGMTTEIAALVMFAVGAAVALQLYAPAVVVTGVVGVLLHWKPQLHKLVGWIGERDIKAIFQLVLIALVILPILPDQAMGPYDVLNPREIWWMVVLIVSISLSAYVAYKLTGAKAGSVLGGVLGGLISSTATTVSYAKQTRKHPEAAPMAALVILIASTIVNGRVLFEIGVVAPQLLRTAAPPLLLMLGWMTILCVATFFLFGNSRADNPLDDNPAQLKTAIIFAALYAIILLAVAAVKANFGSEALYALAVVSGMTDVDAITLSTANLFSSDTLEASTAWRLILIATLANLVFKGVAAAFLGSLELLRYVSILFGLSLLGGLLILVFWPEWEVSF
jgi:uncharacterized membrane protein (DUF4010 family)